MRLPITGLSALSVCIHTPCQTARDRFGQISEPALGSYDPHSSRLHGDIHSCRISSVCGDPLTEVVRMTPSEKVKAQLEGLTKEEFAELRRAMVPAWKRLLYRLGMLPQRWY